MNLLFLRDVVGGSGKAPSYLLRSRLTVGTELTLDIESSWEDSTRNEYFFKIYYIKQIEYIP